MELEALSDPLAALLAWHREALEKNLPEPDACTLATATLSGKPSARIVLFKGIVNGDVQFVTNYASRKGREIAENPAVALVFYWHALLRQVRVEGEASFATAEESDAYFRTRPRESQLGAWASLQSQPVASRAELERRLREVEQRFEGKEVERPEHWGIYRIRVETVELWVAGAHRLHDRCLFTRTAEGWRPARLFP
ncbi:MAG TPA: pyridoxamine 5'-phosphate oxidase [Polyangiaceae bacterium]|nr:pyridoxamine 5'-phosphate oxidase [Polyangiaceae bacterium]